MNKLWILLVAACGSSHAPSVDAVAGDDLYLAIQNVGGHCNVAIEASSPSTDTEVIVADYPEGKTITVSATASPGYTLGPWHRTTNDNGSGDPGTLSGATSSASITLGTSPGCVWICCGSGANDCAVAADPCGN